MPKKTFPSHSSQWRSTAELYSQLSATWHEPVDRQSGEVVENFDPATCEWRSSKESLLIRPNSIGQAKRSNRVFLKNDLVIILEITSDGRARVYGQTSKGHTLRHYWCSVHGTNSILNVIDLPDKFYGAAILSSELEEHLFS